MKEHHPSASDFWKKLGFQFAGLVAVLILLIWGASSGYQQWKARSVEKDAEAEYVKGNYHAAYGAAKRALIEDPMRIGAARIAAQALDKLKSPEAVEAWAKLAQMKKGNVDAAADWARSALNWKRETVALGALHTVPENARDNAPYQATLGDTLILLGRLPEAEAAYEKAVALDPSDRGYWLRHASIVVEHSTDQTKLEIAERALRKLTESPKHAVAARRSIVTLKMSQKNWPAALADNQPLVESADSWIGDRVRQLAILREIGEPGFSAALADIQKNSREARDAAAVTDWMNKNGMAAEALQWAATMEPRMARNPELARRVAESYLILKDWRGLRKQCDDLDNWGPSEYLRNAYAAIALRKMDDLINSSHRWSSAVGSGSGPREAIMELLDLATKWNWRDEVLDVLWNASNRNDADWALARLLAIYLEQGSADGLHRVYARKTVLTPSDDASRGHMVHCALLLDRSMESSVAQARALAARHVRDAGHAATLALAELKGGVAANAYAAFAKVPAEQLNRPEIALYHGLALVAAGRDEEAGAALALAQSHALMPEEAALIPAAHRAAPKPVARGLK